MTQLRMYEPAQGYMAKRRTSGDTKTEALRALRRRISDEVFKRLVEDEAALGDLDAGRLSPAA